MIAWSRSPAPEGRFGASPSEERRADGQVLRLPESHGWQGHTEDLAYVKSRVEGAGSSFFWGMRVLPPAKREACFAVYAFCREVDDIADGDAPQQEKRAALAEWRAEIERLYAGAPNRAVTRVLRRAIEDYGLERDAFLALIDGMEMDANGPIRAPSLDELKLYCARVAGAVGRLCVRIFGIPGPEGRALAESLGRALQLTNILRDLVEDADQGRLYLPRELLSAQGISARDPRAALSDARLPLVCAALGAHARASFAEADAIMARLDAVAVRPARIMAEVYKRPLARMTAQGFRNVTAPRGAFVRALGRAEKAVVALRYAFF
jgi:phytoene synthase